MIMNKTKKILYITGTRADFGLMSPILRSIAASKKLDLTLYATGMHLMPEFGDTFALVRREFKNAKKINAVFNGNKKTGILDFLADFFGQVCEVLEKEKPDLALVLGDRPEMLAVASACLYAGVAVGHVHGGDKTLTNDELARHAITKLAHLHFPATATSARRIQKMGEESWRINIVGAPGLDAIRQQPLLSRKELCAFLKINANEKIILLTQHPESRDWQNAGWQTRQIIEALNKFKLPVVVIYPNSDPGSTDIIKAFKIEKNNPLFRIYPNLEPKIFLSLAREAAVWVGNSSAGLIESASFKTPVVNVGLRQAGRERGENVIDVDYDVGKIEQAVHKSLSDKYFLAKLCKVTNPWGDGRTGRRVARILEDLKVDSRLFNKQITY